MLILLWAALWAHAAPPEAWSGKVVAIKDGDTLEVLWGREAVRVRLHGIDCPEQGQPFGERARQAAGALAAGKTVQVLPRSTDRYGRVVANVLLPDGQSLNEALVRMGLAWWFREYAPRDTRLRLLEEKARQERLGLWAEASPAPPWLWRKAARPGR
jgi:endonuclease YncB( thermonuclease family)